MRDGAVPVQPRPSNSPSGETMGMSEAPGGPVRNLCRFHSNSPTRSICACVDGSLHAVEVRVSACMAAVVSVPVPSAVAAAMP